MSNLTIKRRSACKHSLDGTELPNLLKKVYANRGISHLDELDYSLKNLTDPSVLSNIDAVCDKLYQWIKERKSVCIVGDYDVDGATSTALLLKFFAHCNRPCQYYIPNRFMDGYGLSEKIVDRLSQQSFDAIITVDNGISSLAGVELANQKGIDVIITDHHLPPRQLPNTSYIINPSLEECLVDTQDKKSTDKLKSLAGVGVIFYVLMALRGLLRQKNWFVDNNIDEPNLADYLDLVALGTVADMVPLTFNNRILVSQGLKRMRANAACHGIKALFDVSQKNIGNANTEDLGYAIAPRLNAAGRLDDMSLGVKCLLSKTVEDAQKYADELNDINNQRRAIQAQMQEEAFVDVESLMTKLALTETQSHALVVYQPNWHQGITGLIAGKLKEKYHLPTIAFAQDIVEPCDSTHEHLASRDDTSNDKPKLKGSARSISKIHIKDVLNLVAEANPNLLLAFGGHAMAAGMSLYEKDLVLFKSAFNEALIKYCKQYKLVVDELDAVSLLSDGELSYEEVTVDNITLLEQAGPWGNRFELPVFDNKVIVKSSKLLKDKHMKLSLCFKDNAILGNKECILFDAIYFNYTDKYGSHEINENDELTVVYSLAINRFRGQENAQLMLIHINFA